MAETKIRRGRQITIDPGVKQWQLKMRRYRTLKADIARMLAEKGWSKEDISHWLNTPTPALRVCGLSDKPPRSPKQLMCPDSIAILHEWATKVLRKY